MKLWIARDKSGLLFLYDYIPFEDEDGHWATYGNGYSIDDKLFPEVTFENSPQEIELKLV